MAILLACPSCATRLKVADNLAGRSIKCPKCSTVIRVAAGAAPQPAKALAAAPRKPKPVEDDDAMEEDEDLNDPNIKASPSVKAGKKTRREEEDEEEPRGKSASKKGKGSRHDEEDEDEDDENVKSTAKKGKVPARRGPSGPDRTEEVLEESGVREPFKDQARNELGSGERLVWLGQPAPRLMLLRALGRAIGTGVVGLILFIVGLSIALKDSHVSGMIYIFPVVGVILVVVGGCIPFLARMRARKSLYAITSRRALVWSSNWFGMVHLTNYTPDQLQAMWRRNSWFMSEEGGGDLVFKTVTVITTTHYQNRRGGYAGSRTSRTTYFYGFLSILNAQEVEEILRATLVDPFKKKRRDNDDD